MLTCCRWSLFRVDRVLRFSSTYVNPGPVHCFQGKCSYNSLSCNWKMGGAKHKAGTFDGSKKQKTMDLVWRQVCTQATLSEECSIKDTTMESENGSRIQEDCSVSSNVSDAQHAREVADTADDVTVSTLDSSTLKNDAKDRALEGDSVPSADKHSLSMEIGASVIRFVKGKEGSTQKKIEEDMGVKIIFPSSKKEDSIIIEGISLDDVTRASERIQTIIDEAVKSPTLAYSHFISLPLAIHPELVDKLVNFQNSILGVSHACLNEDVDSDSDKDTSDNEDKDQQSEKVANVAVELKVGDDNEHVEVDLTSIPFVSYAPKASKSSNLSGAIDLGIEKSIFNKPKTFHLTVLMLKLWNKERVNAATEVLKSISSKVMDALDNRPVFVRLKGLDCMKGSLAKARVLYIPVEEAGDGDRLRRACRVITDAFIEAGLVLEKDVNQKLKLHATVMNASHRKKRKSRSKKVDSFDARDIFKQFGSEVWGEYLIREAHLSQRFVFDENGYYHCCASIPFPENMQVD